MHLLWYLSSVTDTDGSSRVSLSDTAAATAVADSHLGAVAYNVSIELHFPYKVKIHRCVYAAQSSLIFCGRISSS